MPRKSLREVLPKSEVEVTAKPTRARRFAPPEPPPPPPRPKVARRKHGSFRSKIIWLGIILVILVGAGFFISKSFASVLVQVIPKRYEVNLGGSAFTVPYESVTIPTVKDSRVVKAQKTTGTPQKASGTIVIYNDYSSKPQALIANTRFEAASGKIYRITKALTVPGTKVVSGKTVPGSIEAVVVADQAGPGYNAPLTDFKIPGFKGDPKYEKFYGRSKTPMTGGTDGESWAMAPAEKEKVVNELKQSLLKKAAEQIRFQIPEDFILYEDNIVATFKEEFVPKDPGEAELTISADAQAIIFKREELGRSLASASIPDGDKQQFSVTNLETLGIKIDQNSLKSDNKKLTVIASGKAAVELSVDPDILRQKLLGSSSVQANQILSEFPSIEKAQVNFRPPWIREFPKNATGIKVETI